MPINLRNALCFAHGDSVVDEEFSLNGITEVSGVDAATSALLHNLPKSLRTLEFAPRFNRRLHYVRLPAGLQTLTLGCDFNQSLDNITWPGGLQSLTLALNFNQSLDNVTWPANLQSLTFGQNFNQSLDNVTWPAGLQSLTFGRKFNQSLDNVTWPAGLRSLTFGRDFNQSLDNVTWPAGLQSLTFGLFFNHIMDNMTRPAGLQCATVGTVLSQNLDNVTWPAGLQSLTFGGCCDQSVDNVTWPANLQCVTFGEFFNQSLDNVTWPAGLQCVTFGEFFDQRLDNLTWSAGLQSLTFGENFNQSLDNVTWPANLQSLTFGQNFNQSLDNVTWPAGLRSLTFGRRFHQSLDNVTWPAGLRNLTFDCFSFEKLNVVWPEGLQSLSFLDIQLPEKRQPAVENSAVSDSVDSKVVRLGQDGPGHYVNWFLTILFWCVEIKIVCSRWGVGSFLDQTGEFLSGKFRPTPDLDLTSSLKFPYKTTESSINTQEFQQRSCWAAFRIYVLDFSAVVGKDLFFSQKKARFLAIGLVWFGTGRWIFEWQIQRFFRGIWLHPWRLKWNIIMEVWFRSFSFPNRWFVGSMLIFQGVTHLFIFWLWVDISFHVVTCKLSALYKSLKMANGRDLFWASENSGLPESKSLKNQLVGRMI